MTRSRLILLVILSATISAGLTAWLTRRYFPPSQAKNDQPTESKALQRDFHQWLHDQLELSPGQKAELAPAEQQFEMEHSRLQKELTTISGELAHALGEPSHGSEDLQPLITERHRLQGEIQKLIMAHLLEKRALLTPEQRKQYQEWIHESIEHDHGD